MGRGGGGPRIRAHAGSIDAAVHTGFRLGARLHAPRMALRRVIGGLVDERRFEDSSSSEDEELTEDEKKVLDPSPLSYDELQLFGGCLAFGGVLTVSMVAVLYLLGAGA